MPFTSGTLTACSYRTDKPCPADARERYARALTRDAFRPINAEKGETQSAGWVDPRNILSSSLRWDSLALGAYLFLGLRIDKKTLPKMLLKAHVREALRAAAKEKKVKQLSRTERQMIQEKVAADLFRQASPSIAVHEMAWNMATGEVFFTSPSRAANDFFADYFLGTFDLELVVNHPLARANETAASLGQAIDLQRMPPSWWGTGNPVAGVHNESNSGGEE